MIREIVKVKRHAKPIEIKIRNGIKDLRNMPVVTKQADKNLGLVPIRGDIYAAMERKWLVPPSFTEVQEFPHADIVRRIENTIRSTWAITYEAKQIWIMHARQAKDPCPFYVIPKIHKHNPLGSRPISAQHSYIMAPLSKALTTKLLMVQHRLQGITQDTRSFIRRIEQFRATKPFVLLTYDVEACYPSIDLDDAIQTLHDNIDVMRHYYGFWTKILKLIMYNNYVTTNNKIYRQMIGTATGTQVAPPFANLYLFYKFKDVLNDPEILLHERFIDDGFVLVSTKDHAKRIINMLNTATNLNLTHEIHDDHAVFLDLVIHKGDRFDEEKRLDLKTYFKPTNRLLFLPWISNHPRSMKTGIITGEAIRTLRNSSNKVDWLRSLTFLFKGFMARGYSAHVIQQTWKKIRWEDRSMFIDLNSSKSTPLGIIALTTYHEKTKQIWNSLLSKHPFQDIFVSRKKCLNKSQAMILKKWPPTIVWSNFKKIGHRIISAKDSWSYRCLTQMKRRRDNEERNIDERNKKRRRKTNA